MADQSLPKNTIRLADFETRIKSNKILQKLTESNNNKNKRIIQK